MKNKKEIKGLLESLRRNALLYGATLDRISVIKCLEWVLKKEEKNKEVVEYEYKGKV